MRSHNDVTSLFNVRLLRWAVWSLLMITALIVTACFDLRRTILVPMVFLPLMIPIIFLPFKNTKKAGESA